MKRRGFLQALSALFAAPAIPDFSAEKWLGTGMPPIAGYFAFDPLGARGYVGCAFYTRAVVLNDQWMCKLS